VDGSLVALWNDYELTAQRFSSSGAPRGEPLVISQNQNRQAWSAIGLQAGGSFVVAWTDVEGRDGDSAGVFGRAFAANGTPRTGDFRINVTTAGDQYVPAIAAARQGPVVVAWTQQLAPDGRSEIFARVLSAEP
jgi:serralysin